ncbi:copper resistance D family protein [Lysinibacillus fusiformis]|uniref:copper resistance D family protein n=1 Tax=Lysinibacillus fusiformis TaxID=28031 RepID=UPI000E331644|nr:CopD family protein [Lysinibacillus fusiformis]AXQ50897.1 copper resistance protein CopD [Stenotrophomonas rhizophila]KAB0447232.1 copper resistance protein CopD [Lysinibacillus fusiformis]
MFSIAIFSEPFLYICFSILIGSFLLQLIPSNRRSEFKVKKGVLMAATAGIAIFSFMPVLQTILYLHEDIGFWNTLLSVVLGFTIGKAWIATYLISNILFLYIVWFDYWKRPINSYVGLIFTLILIFILGWSSHAASIEEWSGFLIHSIHFIAISVWIGILLIVSWFSTNQSNWLNFLKWFSPVAATCFIITIITGLLLMKVVIDYSDYTNSWMLPYGQSLLIKHLLIIPLVLYAFINSILVKRNITKNPSFNPIPWTKAESLIVFLIFAATAILSQQEPPHEIEITIASSGISNLFDLLYAGNVTKDTTILLGFNLNAIILYILGVLFLALSVITYMKRTPAFSGFMMSVLSVISLYLALMMSIQ